MKNKKKEEVHIVFIEKPKLSIKESIKNFIIDWIEPITNIAEQWFSVKEYTKIGLFTIFPFKLISGIVLIPWMFLLYVLFTICYCIVMGLILLLGFIMVEVVENRWEVILNIKKIFYK